MDNRKLFKEVTVMRILSGLKGILMMVLMSISFLLQGCAALVVGGAAAGAGVTTVAYIKGDLQTTCAASLNPTWEGSMAALKDLEIRVASIQKDATGGLIEATRADGTRVRITLSPAGPDTTSVKIRIGVFGNREASMAIHRQIETKLKTAQGV